MLYVSGMAHFDQLYLSKHNTNLAVYFLSACSFRMLMAHLAAMFFELLYYVYDKAQCVLKINHCVKNIIV